MNTRAILAAAGTILFGLVGILVAQRFLGYAYPTDVTTSARLIHDSFEILYGVLLVIWIRQKIQFLRLMAYALTWGIIVAFSSAFTGYKDPSFFYNVVLMIYGASVFSRLVPKATPAEPPATP